MPGDKNTGESDSVVVNTIYGESQLPGDENSGESQRKMLYSKIGNKNLLTLSH
jgi:hypothetical protein